MIFVSVVVPLFFFLCVSLYYVVFNEHVADTVAKGIFCPMYDFSACRSLASPKQPKEPGMAGRTAEKERETKGKAAQRAQEIPGFTVRDGKKFEGLGSEPPYKLVRNIQECAGMCWARRCAFSFNKVQNEDGMHVCYINYDPRQARPYENWISGFRTR